MPLRNGADVPEILQGLVYIRQELHVCHPVLDPDQILLGEKGDIKIGRNHSKTKTLPRLIMRTANIGDSLLSGATASGEAHELGLLLFGLMEPGTRMADNSTIALRSTDAWGEQIRDFLRLTAQESLETLRHVSQKRLLCT